MCNVGRNLFAEVHRADEGSGEETVLGPSSASYESFPILFSSGILSTGVSREDLLNHRDRRDHRGGIVIVDLRFYPVTSAVKERYCALLKTVLLHLSIIEEQGPTEEAPRLTLRETNILIFFFFSSVVSVVKTEP